jgi:hypothetical protein
LMVSNQTGDLMDKQHKVSGYGLGLGVHLEKNNGRTQAVYWAGGPYNTVFNIDFEKQVISILLTQNSPWSHLDLMNKFITTVKQNVP